MREILKKLDRTINNFTLYMLKLPASSLYMQKSQTWSPHQVLIHIVFWHEQYCNIIHALLGDEKPILLQGSFKDSNAFAVEVNKNETRERLITRLKNAQEVLALLCKDKKSKKIYISFKEGGKKRSLLEALTKIEGHIRSHQRQLLRLGFK